MNCWSTVSAGCASASSTAAAPAKDSRPARVKEVLEVKSPSALDHGNVGPRRGNSPVLAEETMIIEIVSATAPATKRDEFGKAMASLVGPIQVQRGCLSCLLSQTWPMGEELQIEARWDNEANLTAHLQSDICKKLLLLVELSAAPPALEFFAVNGVRGLDLVEAARTSPE